MFNDRFLSDLEFHVEVWDEKDLKVTELMAACSNVLVARAAFNEAVKARPGRIVRLRHRARVIAKVP